MRIPPKERWGAKLCEGERDLLAEGRFAKSGERNFRRGRLKDWKEGWA